METTISTGIREAVEMVVRCGRCGQALGYREGARLFIAHAGREIAATLPVQQTCHRCGEVTSTGLSS